MTLRAQIKSVLEDVPETRNSDIALMLEIWRRYYPTRIHTDGTGLESVLLRDINDLPREDHVKRIRAEFNSKGLYWPTDPAVAQARRINEDKWRESLGYEPKKSDGPVILD